MLTIVYVRVSTDDQVEHSPGAQRKRCVQYAQQHDLGAPTFLADEGKSGKDLNRPGMQELIARIEADEVAHLIVWRIDRLSRDAEDMARLMKLAQTHCVTVHSVSEGPVDTVTATGRLVVGFQGLIAQHERDKIIENVKMGQQQAAEKGLWLNRPPTGYDLVNGELIANDSAPLIHRCFQLRAQGLSYSQIENATGIKFSTVAHIIKNRAYLGEVKLGPNWYPGRHQPIVTADEFTRAQKAHTPGQRRAKDLLSGKVRCGECDKIATINHNARSRYYKCKHRGSTCNTPGRAADGLLRVAVLGLEILRTDEALIAAILASLTQHSDRGGNVAAPPTRSATIASWARKREKLLELYYADSITTEYFAEKEREITTKIAALEQEQHELLDQQRRNTELAHTFQQAIEQLNLDQIPFDQIWQHATPKERRILIEDLIEAIHIHHDHLEVTVTGALPFIILPEEVGLRGPSSRPYVSEGGLEPPRP